MEETLFSAQIKRPLADRLRPQTLKEVVGQDHIVGEDAPLGRMVKGGKDFLFYFRGASGVRKNNHCPLDCRKYQSLF